MADLLDYLDRFDPGSAHHRAAFNLLQDNLPPELLQDDADWILLFETQQIELTYNKRKSERA